MIRRRQIALTLAALTLGAPAAPAAAATPGGAPPGVIVLPGPPPTVVHVGNPLLRARADGVSIAVHASAMMRGRVRIAGSVARGHGGSIRIERLDPHAGWVAVSTVPVARDGSFHALWRPARAGTTQLRALRVTGASGTGGGAGSAGAAASDGPQIRLAVYHPGLASWYGPGLYGTTTACGVALTSTTIGVANRTLPCGTQVAMYARGRTVVVPVIDRGPFVHGRAWDLTLAAFRALGGGDGDGVLRIGALAVPATPARASR